MRQEFPIRSSASSEKTTSVAPQVIVLRVSRGPLKNFSYLVVDPHTRMAVLIDPAWEEQKIVEEITRANVTLGGILVTHAHPDHTDLAFSFAERYHVPIWASSETFSQLPTLLKYAQILNNPPFEIGGLRIEAIPTPGHTSGCVCFLIGNNLFSGDTLFAEGCGMCYSLAAAHAMFSSLETLKHRLHHATRIFPGHSYGVPTGQFFSTLLRENIYLQFNSRESFTAFRLRSGQNLARMFQFS